MQSLTRKGVALAVSATTITASLFAAGLPARAINASSGPVVAATGLNNPRQLSLTQDGVLLVAEAGNGGSKCVTGGEEGEQCVGTSGSVSALFQPQTSVKAFPVRVQQGLLSAAAKDGSQAVGSNGVSSEQFFNHSIYTSISYAPPESLPRGIPGDQAGKLLSGKPGEAPSVVADVTAYELANDPDGHGPDSNPYAVLDMRDYRLIADAAANTVFKVTNDGKVSVFHVFPNITTKACTTPSPDGFPGFDPTPQFPGCNFVPTSLALGPDSDIYVGGLASLNPGQGRVVRLDHATGAEKRTYTGFGPVTGVALSNDGSVYVSQLTAKQANPQSQVPGVVTRVRQDGSRNSVDVPFPAGVAVDQAQNVYVAAYSVSPATGTAGAPAGVDTSGQIWRMRF